MSRTREEAINSYITDMLALEDHIEKALRAQVSDFKEEHPEVVSRLSTIQQTSLQHIEALKALSDERKAGAGHSIAEVVKRAGSMVAGLGAAAVDLIRNEKLPKDLRDDYTALSLGAIGYVMLFTTARALDDARVADVAERHLNDYAKAVMTLHNMVPAAVIKLLQQDELPAHSDVLPAVGRSIVDAWRNSSEEVEEVGSTR